MATELEELVGFMANPNPQVRLLATENSVPYSLAQPDVFKANGLKPLKDLKLLVKDHPKIAEHVITILINISADAQVLESLATDDKFLDTILSYVVKPQEPNANLLSMLLANIAKWDGFKSVLHRKQPAPAELGSDERVLNQLLDLFVKGADGTYNKDADFDHLAYVFADLTKHDEIRQHYVQRQDYDGVIPITKLKVFTEHKSAIRRKGVASTIKNVAFDVPSHTSMLSSDGIDILPYILLPIMGNEEYDEEETMGMLPELQLLPPDKTRDPDPQNIQTHVETLLLFSSTRKARDYMREIEVYPIIRETHLRVEHDGVKEACERLVQVLKRDEEEPNSEPRVEEVGEVGDVDEDDDDNKIVEV